MWKEVFYNQKDEEYTPPIFKEEKTNVPNQNMVPKPLQTMLNTVESNLQDKRNWNHQHLKVRNLPKEEYLALLKLIEMQNDRLIVVKPADKGAGIVIMNYDDYVTSCNKHLTATQPQPAGPPLPYYKKATTQDFNKLKQSIDAVLDFGKQNEYLSNVEYKMMRPVDKGAGRFYQLYKVHKSYPEGCLPPGRPIVSGNGSLTENLSKFVDHHSKILINNIPSFIQDSPDFLRTLDTLNQSNQICDTDILVTIDVSSLYTNIKQEDGIEAMRTALNKRDDKTIPTEYLLQLLELVLKGNIFEFGNQLYQQLVGTAMGTPSAPTYATVFMAELDIKIYNLAKNIAVTEDPIRILKRFLDDIFLIWKGNLTDLIQFLDQINNLHPTIKFTYDYTCPYPCTYPSDIQHDCFCYTSRSIPFLDTLVTIKNKTIVTDVYRKPTDRCQYLLPTSNHPAHITTNIPYSLCYRLVRICSEKETLNKRFSELKQLLQNRSYNDKIIDGAISKAKLIERKEALKKKDKKISSRIPFVITYHPALPSISNILNKAWRVMIKDEHMKKVFPEPPMVAYRQPKNSSIRQMLIKSKLPTRERKSADGMKKCNKPGCSTCPFVKEGKVVKSSANNFQVKIKTAVNCETSNLVYIISCDKPACKFIQYVGETGKKLKERFSQHLQNVKSENCTTSTGEHFNLPNHSIANMNVSIVEKCCNDSKMYRKIRESFFINKFETKHLGLNRKM